jgi:hypothetical protein
MKLLTNHIRKIVGVLLCFAVIISMVGCKNNHLKGHRPAPVVAQAPAAVDNVIFTAAPTKQPVAHAQRHVHMLVLVHGTVLPLPSWSAFWQSTKQKDGSWYQNYLNQLRYHELYATQPIGEFGLHAINQPAVGNVEFSINQLAACFLTKAYQSDTKYVDTEIVCYTFGWDGRLDHKHRLAWGKRLYKELGDEIARLKKQHPNAHDTVMLDIFAHSHGGNVALNMVHALTNDKHLPWTVNRLVLLGTPVQRETADLIQSPLFNRVYSIYSRGDAIQNLDFLSTKAGKSARRFDAMIDTTKQSKLVQIEVKVDHKKPTHVDLWFFKRWRLSLAVEPRDQVPVFVFVPLAFPSLEGDLRSMHDVAMNIESGVDAYAVQLRAKQLKTKKPAPLLQRIICCAKDDFKRPGVLITATSYDAPA